MNYNEDTPILSVITVCFNAGPSIIRTLESVLAQGAEPPPD